LEGLLRQVLERHPKQVKLVIKNFPLANHAHAFKAATAALAAHRQGKYWQFHRQLMENHSRINDTTIQEIVERLKLDADRHRSDMQSPEIRKLIQSDMKNGREIGVRGTPTIFINGKMLKKRTPAGFDEAIAAEVEKKR
jgi:protein-disulfide isomerase